MEHVTPDHKDARRRRLRCLVVVFCVVGLATVSAVFLLRLAEPRFYRAVILPSYGGQPFRPFAMNDRNQIVGLVTTRRGGLGVALWDREQGIRELGIGFSEGTLAINNAGQIGGEMCDPNGKTLGFLWDPNAGMSQIGPAGVDEGRLFAIGDGGRIVGAYKTDSGSVHACMWEDTGRMRDLNPPGASCSAADHINSSGQVLGHFDHNTSDRGLCLWDLADPNFTDWMSVPGESTGLYRDLNNGGYVLGEGLCPEERPGAWPRRYAMLWHRDKDPTWLFPLVNLDAHVAYLNDANQVVYYETHRSTLSKWFPRRFPPCTRLFLWDPTHGSISLDKCLKLGGRDYFAVCDLNNEGCIVGVVESGKGVRKRAVLLEPIAGKWRR